MEDEPLIGSSSISKKQTYSDALDEVCAYYMAIGVSCDEFWHGDYTRLEHYQKAHETKNEMRNQEMWMQGLYIFDAVSIAMSNALRKSGKPESYIKKPYDLKPKEKTEEDIAAEQEAARQKVVHSFSAWADNWKQIYGAGGEKR